MQDDGGVHGQPGRTAGAVVFCGHSPRRLPAAWIIPASARAVAPALASMARCGAECAPVSPCSARRSGMSAGSCTPGCCSLASSPPTSPSRARWQPRGRGAAGLRHRVTVRHFLADLPLDPALIPGLPADLHGARTWISRWRSSSRHHHRASGAHRARDLEDRSGRATPLGSFVVTFPAAPGSRPASCATSTAHSPSRHAAPDASAGLRARGLVAPRAGAAPELVNNIRYLGSPDATGRRPFSVAGTF